MSRNNTFNRPNSSDKDENNNAGEEKQQQTAAKVDELISQDRVVIFSKSTCPYCDNAKKVFDRLGQSYSTVELSDHPNGQEVQSVLKERTGAGTVPRVFVDGVCIGGGNDTVQLYRNGQLEQILRQRSADALNSQTDDNNNNEREGGSGEKFM